jgi:hypothetical protein
LVAFRAAARLGDLVGSMLGRRMPLDSGALDKLVGSAVFSNYQIVDRLGFRPRRTLADGIRAIVEELPR